MKSRTLDNDLRKQICKLVFHNLHVEKSILQLLKSTSLNELVAEAATVMANECKELCKRNSGSILQDRSRDGILAFSWDNLYEELQIRAPHPLMLVSTMMGDILVTVQSKNPCQFFFCWCHSSWKIQRNNSPTVFSQYGTPSWRMHS